MEFMFSINSCLCTRWTILERYVENLRDGCLDSWWRQLRKFRLLVCQGRWAVSDTCWCLRADRLCLIFNGSKEVNTIFIPDLFATLIQIFVLWQCNFFSFFSDIKKENHSYFLFISVYSATSATFLDVPHPTPLSVIIISKFVFSIQMSRLYTESLLINLMLSPFLHMIYMYLFCIYWQIVHLHVRFFFPWNMFLF